MGSEHFKKIEEIYHAALDIPKEKLESFLKQMCGEDENLRKEIESLLEFDSVENSFIDTPPEDLAAEFVFEQEKTPKISQKIGRYNILSLLGEGGMGTVYLAQDTKLLRNVALKILPPEMVKDENRVHRFMHEARSASALNHPNILTIYEIDEFQPSEAEKIHYIAMEFVDGETLHELIYRKKANLKTLFKYLAQTADGLSKAHSAGIVHRDLKPENIMVTSDGFAKILDFGLVKLVENESTLGSFQQHKSKPGVILGTLGYMSPEQAQGNTEIDQRSDIFSYGCILYEAITKKKPFTTDSTVDALYQIIHSKPESLSALNPKISVEIQEIVSKCLKKDPDERFQKIKDVSKHLQKSISNLEEIDSNSPEIREQITVVFENGVSTNTTSQSISERRRQTTVLFADFSVLSELFEDSDPEEASGTMNDLWVRLDEIIQKGGGRIDKRLSDVFIAVWVAEGIREDDPERAIRTALELQNEAGKYFSKNLSGQFEGLEEIEDETPRLLKIGISTGMIVLGVSSDSGEFLTTGSAVNTAKRLRQNAPAGSILVSHDTYRHVRGVFDVEAFELEKRIELKRNKEILKVYQVKRAKPRAFRLRGRDVEGIETKLVGRKGELERMFDALYTVLEDGEMEVLTIVGEAGLGKSRLLFEFRDQIELLPDKIRVFNARAAESMSSLPFSLLRDFFSLRFEIQDSDSHLVACEKLVKGLLELSLNSAGEFGKGEEAEMKAHFIGQLIGLDFSASSYVKNILNEPQQIRTRAIHYTTQFFAAIAEEFPVLLYLDDLHWADDESLEFFEHLANSCADSRLLILNFTRPLLFERRPHWGEGQKNHSRLTLQPLTKRESRQMVKDILQMMEYLPQNLRDLIVENAEGNPFYVEELIKMFIDRGAIIKGTETWRVNEDRLGKTNVPPTLNGVLQARLDRLSEWEKVILQRASIIGRKFWDSALENVGTERNISAVLESLRRKELIFRHETSAFSNANEYIFKHALLRDVTYETVLLRERRELHSKIADWLIKSSGEREIEYAASIAEHFEKVQNFERSANWYGRDGEQAQKTHAPQIASIYYQKALKLLNSLPETDEEAKLKKLIDWNKGLGETYQLQAKFTESIEAYNSMLKVAEKTGDTLSKAHAFYGLTVAQFEQGDTRTALESSHKATQFASRSGSSAEANKILADALFREARAFAGLGDYENSIKLSNEALEVTAKLGDTGINEHSKNLHMLCAANHALGKFGKAIEFQEQGLALMREFGNQQNEAYALNTLGVVHHARGDFLKAIVYYNEALDIMNKLGNRSAQIIIISNIGGSQIALGDFKTAEQKLRQLLEMTGEDNHFILPETHYFLAQSLLGQNRYEEALLSAQTSLKIVQETENAEITGVAWRVLGMIASRLQKDIQAGDENINAEKCLERSLEIFTKNKMEAEIGHSLKSLAQHKFDCGEKKSAEILMKQAEEIFERLKMNFKAEFS